MQLERQNILKMIWCIQTMFVFRLLSENQQSRLTLPMRYNCKDHKLILQITCTQITARKGCRINNNGLKASSKHQKRAKSITLAGHIIRNVANILSSHQLMCASNSPTQHEHLKLGIQKMLLFLTHIVHLIKVVLPKKLTGNAI